MRLASVSLVTLKGNSVPIDTSCCFFLLRVIFIILHIIKSMRPSKKKQALVARAKKAALAKKSKPDSLSDEECHVESESDEERAATSHVQTPTPSTSTGSTPSVECVSSAKKRKKLFNIESTTTGVKADESKFLVGMKEFSAIFDAVVCAQCSSQLACSFDTTASGTDCPVIVKCFKCNVEVYNSNPLIQHLSTGTEKFYSETMSIIYNAMLQGMAFESVTRYCAISEKCEVNKRQYLKYKSKVVEAAVQKTAEHLETCIEKVFKYYAETLDRHPDEDGVLDIDVTYDGK